MVIHRTLQNGDFECRKSSNYVNCLPLLIGGICATYPIHFQPYWRFTGSSRTPVHYRHPMGISLKKAQASMRAQPPAHNGGLSRVPVVQRRTTPTIEASRVLIRRNPIADRPYRLFIAVGGGGPPECPPGWLATVSTQSFPDQPKVE